MNVRLILALVLCLSALPLSGEERIIAFTSLVTVNKDSSLDVQERITVAAEGNQVVHGITREFPTRYRGLHGHLYNVGFKVNSVSMDGQPVPMSLNSWQNGVIVRLGDPNYIVKPGVHTYDISYTTTRQLGFFKKFDELYWNVNGNGWRLPIESIHATIVLPGGISHADIAGIAYTGFFGQQGKDFTASVIEGKSSTQVIFTSTRKFEPREGLTVAVNWPKGIINQPGFVQKAFWFLSDNKSVLLLLLALIIVMLIYLPAWLVVRRRNKPGTVIPLFNPPTIQSIAPATQANEYFNQLLPSEVRFVDKMGYDSQCFAAEVVNMAVQGFITIDYQKSYFAKGTYTLKRTKKPLDEAHPIHQIILSELFGDDNKPFKVGGDSYSKILADTVKSLGDMIKKRLELDTFTNQSDTIGYGIIFSLCAFFGALALNKFALRIGDFVVLGVIALVNVLFIRRMKHYTVQGRQLMDEIDGFKMYLSTAELEQMKMMGTPPQKTPQLYEKYLPYAIALGLEKEWGKQFAPLFAQRDRNNVGYQPIWYHGSYGYAFDSASFSTSLSQSLSSVISSSSSAPGSSSGSGGGGSSGGGGGGGGGGGW